MASKRLNYEIGVDPSKGIQGLKQFSGAAKKAMKDVDESMDDTTTSAQKVAKALSGLADDIESEMKGAAKAAASLSDALGPELAGRANVDSIVADLHKMGLTFDEITADADTLAGSLKKLDGVQLQGIEASSKRTKDNVAEVGRSADSSKGALANMVGNSAQDLGNLGGVAGSTGVAIGQMAEYMADAALEGESLGAVAANFAKVALPILAIGAAIGTFQQALGSLKKDEKEAAEITKDLGDAFKETGDWTQAATKVLEAHGVEFEKYTNRITSLGEAIDTTILGKGLSKIPLIGSNFKQASTDVVAGLAAIGKSTDDLAQTTEGNVIFNREFEQSLKDGLKTGKLTERQYKDIEDAVHSYQIEVKEAKDAQAKLNLTAKTFHNTVEAITLQANPLKHYTDLWDQLFRAINSGNDAAAASLANTLAMLLHIPDPAQVVAIAMGAIADKAAETTNAFNDAADAIEQWGEKTAADVETFAISLDQAQGSVDDLAGSFSQMGIAADALGAIFDLGNRPLEALGEIQDVNEAIRDLQTFIGKDLKGVVPDIFDPNDINAGPFLDKIASLREPVQAKIIEAFSAGGAPAAQATADAYIKQISESMKGQLSEDQVRTLLGLTDLNVKLKVAVDQTALANAQKELAILVGLGGETPYTASIGLALQTGELSPQAAQKLINEQLKGLGVQIPTKLDPPATAEAKAEADRWAANNPVDIPSNVDPSGAVAGTMDARNAGQDVANRNPIVIPVIAKSGSRGVVLPYDQGGTVQGVGLVAEKRPEIVNSRYLVTQPTIVPAGTRVTSGARTARIMRHGGPRGLKAYDRGGTVMAGPQTINVNINGVGAIGNRYDLMRTVTKAARDNLRLLGSRG